MLKVQACLKKMALIKDKNEINVFYYVSIRSWAELGEWNLNVGLSMSLCFFLEGVSNVPFGQLHGNTALQFLQPILRVLPFFILKIQTPLNFPPSVEI